MNLRLVHQMKQFHKDLNADWQRHQKAAQNAVKIEGFAKKKLLDKELRAGAPGGRPFAPLSGIAQKTRRKKVPFTRLHSTRLARGSKGLLPTRYQYEARGGRFEYSFGFIDSGRQALGRSWIRIIKKIQEGFSTPVDPDTRRYFIRWGSSLTKRSKFRKYFFLKKHTTRLHTPARPIIDPFLKAYRGEMMRNIPQHFEKKLRGQRV